MSPPARPRARSLIADPQRARFGVTAVAADAPFEGNVLGIASLGDRQALARWDPAGDGAFWQLGLSAKAVGLFDLNSKGQPLINTDFSGGLSLDHRHDDRAWRLRLYHQSSHLGDEYIELAGATSRDLSLESLELLHSRTLGAWRIYGGGEVFLRREPNDLDRGLLHGGIEYRGESPRGRLGNAGGVYRIAGLDVKAPQYAGFSPAVSLKLGWELRPAAPRDPGRRWRLLLEGYDGPAPFGQFFDTDLSYVGLTLEWNG